MSGNQKPVGGLGGGAVAVGTTGVVATQLPKTGASDIVVFALCALAGLAVWGITYMALRKKQA